MTRRSVVLKLCLDFEILLLCWSRQDCDLEADHLDHVGIVSGLCKEQPCVTGRVRRDVDL
jgi:hypothetical protein